MGRMAPTGDGTGGRGEVRVGRRTLERRGPAGRWRDVRGFGLVLLMLVAAAILVVLTLLRILGPAIGLGPATSAVDALGRPLTVDVPVNNAMAGLRYDEMVGDAGKDRLKSAIRDAVNAALPQAPVEQVYIRELLV